MTWVLVLPLRGKICRLVPLDTALTRVKSATQMTTVRINAVPLRAMSGKIRQNMSRCLNRIGTSSGANPQN